MSYFILELKSHLFMSLFMSARGLEHGEQEVTYGVGMKYETVVGG